MKKKIKSLAVLCLMLILTFVSKTFLQQVAQNVVVVLEYSGKVQIVRNNAPLNVNKGMVLYENDVIKTLKNGSIVLLFQDGSLLSLSENTVMTIRALIDKISLSMDKGKVKTKVVPRQVSHVFEIKTPVSVASVRGTEFILVFENNTSELYVLEGEVNFEDILGNVVIVSAMEQCYISEQGIGAKSLVDREKIKTIEKMFKSIEEKLKQEESYDVEDKKEKLNMLKDELKNFVSETKAERYYIYEIIQQIKDADFQAGRTLRDVHGNLTRVEQIISRSKSNNIEFINITKRDSYVYKGYFDYTNIVNTTKPRVDIFRIGIEFNNSLPQKISEWPRFISQQKENFWPTKVYIELTNLKDKFYSETTFTKIEKEEPIYSWEPKFDEFGNYIGSEQVVIGSKKEKRLEGTTVNTVSNGEVTYTIDTNYDESLKGNLPEGKSKEDEDGKLWFWAEGPFPVKEDINNDGKNDNKDILWIQTEGYLINNDGKILTPSYFTGESKDPFTVLKEIAVESCIFVRKDNGNGTGPGEAFFNKNIDLVATPDIIISLAKNIAASLRDVAKD